MTGDGWVQTCCCCCVLSGTEVHPDQAVEWAFSAFYCSFGFEGERGERRRLKTDASEQKHLQLQKEVGWPEQNSF